jgi:hypothetical protein
MDLSEPRGPEEAGALPAHHPEALKRWPDLQPITRAERVVIVAVESKGFRARVLRRLKLEGYHPLEVEFQALFDTEPVFDVNRMVFCFLEASEDKELMHELLRHLYQQWSNHGRGLIFAFWPSGFNDSDTFRIFGLEGTTWATAPHQFNSISKRSSERNEEILTELLFQMIRYP